MSERDDKHIWELIKEYREMLGYSISKMAFSLGLNYNYYSRMEKPLIEGHVIPSEAVLRKLARIVAKGDTEKEKEVLEKLLLARARDILPPEIFEKAVSHVKEFSDSMPEEFIRRLLIDLRGKEMSKIVLISKIPESVINEVIEGKRALSRDSVIRLALALEQPAHEYLRLAGYITDDIVELLKEEQFAKAFFRVTSEISPEVVSKVMLTLLEILESRKGK
ncbi:MAG: helix-turn-helix domain-containing protein [Dictyoglomus turgidum]